MGWGQCGSHLLEDSGAGDAGETACPCSQLRTRGAVEGAVVVGCTTKRETFRRQMQLPLASFS